MKDGDVPQIQVPVTISVVDVEQAELRVGGGNALLGDLTVVSGPGSSYGSWLVAYVRVLRVAKLANESGICTEAQNTRSD